jgi:tRNA(fMet)-specific endonuclease VapC
VLLADPTRLALRLQWTNFLLRVESLPWDTSSARQCGDLRAPLERTGSAMGNLDMMIAAQALACEAVLVTSDRVFRRVKGLPVEDWTR